MKILPTVGDNRESYRAAVAVSEFVRPGDRTWLSRLISTSVNEKVASTARCSVLVVRS